MFFVCNPFNGVLYPYQKPNQEEERHLETGGEGEGYQRKRSYRDSFEEQEPQHDDDHEVVHNDGGAHGNGIDYVDASAVSIHDKAGKGEEEDMKGEEQDGMDDDRTEGRARGGEEVLEEHSREKNDDGGSEKEMVEREGERSRSVDEAAGGEGVTSMSKQEAFTMEGKGDMVDLDSGGAVASETRDYEKKQYRGKEGREERSEKKSRKERKRKEKRSRREKVGGDD